MLKRIEKLVIAKNDYERQEIAKSLSQEGAKGIDSILLKLQKGENLRLYLLTLTRMIGKAECLERLDKVWRNVGYRPLIEYSKLEDAKIRKNAYILMGNLKSDIIKNTLIQALDTEDTLFLISSLILAVGKADCVSALDKIKELKTYYTNIQNNANDIENTKHYISIVSACDKAIDRLSKDRLRHTFSSFPEGLSVLLTTNAKNANITLKECRDYFPSATIQGSRILINKPDYNKILKIRSYQELLIPYANEKLLPFKPKAIANAISYNLLDSMHTEKGLPYRYRIEMMDHKEEIPLIIQAITKAYGDKLINSTTDYEVEIRIRIKRDKCSINIKLYTLLDTRFDYRVNAIPASISGPNAGLCMRLIEKHLREKSRVLDAFCGTATMLIERNRYNPNCMLTAVDNSEKAIELAKENCLAAKVPVKLIHQNILNFKTPEPFDEIISNMPYGVRVGSHRANTMLYKSFVTKLDKLLAPNGIAILLTIEHKMLKVLAEEYRYELLDEFVIDSGGLAPHLMVFSKK